LGTFSLEKRAAGSQTVIMNSPYDQRNRSEVEELAQWLDLELSLLADGDRTALRGPVGADQCVPVVQAQLPGGGAADHGVDAGNAGGFAVVEGCAGQRR
jgi:hypothetical protein